MNLKHKVPFDFSAADESGDMHSLRLFVCTVVPLNAERLNGVERFRVRQENT
jgi:hypothetical protein